MIRKCLIVLFGIGLFLASASSVSAQKEKPKLPEVKPKTELAPDGKAFANKVLSATRRVGRDPKRLAGLVDRLKNPALEERNAATVELSYGGDAAVNALLAALADEGRASEHTNIRTALVD